MRSGLKVILFGGAFFPGAVVAFDFQRGRYRVGSGSGFTAAFTAVPGVSYSRASVGYAATSSGALVLFQSGQPRITDQGLLIEESRTNLQKWSQDFTNAVWTKGGASVGSATATAAPDGTQTGNSLSSGSGAGTHQLYQRISLTANTTNVMSLYVKPNAGRYFFLSVQSGTSGIYTTAVFDLQGGGSSATQTAVGGSSGTIISTAQTAVAGGWYRLSITGSLNEAAPFVVAGVAGAATGNSLTATGSVTFNAAGTETFFIWQEDLQAGSVLTSPIPTTSAAATRAADALTVTYSPSGSSAVLAYGASSTATPSPASPINIGASSGGAWVNGFVRSLLVQP